ncbi:MAG: protein kinase [Planctomycetes bacterium]|nr:protein kinase [Planctomycetota bacterium]
MPPDDGDQTGQVGVQPVAADRAAHPRYDFGEVLGQGATAQVVVAHDRTFGRDVAIKIMQSAGGEAQAEVLREARITAQLDHPNIVTVHDLDRTDDGQVFLVMRRIKGTSLDELVRRAAAGETPEAVATAHATVTIIVRICNALEKAHGCGIVHRDVKPGNILVGDHGEVVLADWGEALRPGEAQDGGMVVGTPAYMPPEQARGGPVDARSDIYAVGATLFHVLALRAPACAEDTRTAIAARARGEAPVLGDAERRRVPAALQAVIRQAMDPDPARRYQRVADLRADLVRYQEGLPVAALREPHAVRCVRWLWRHRRRVGIALTALVVVGGLGAALGMQWHRQHERWGDPVLTQSFADAGWTREWREHSPGTWRVDGGRLVSTGQGAAFLSCRRRLQPPVAIEYTGEILPGSQPCDLSAIWREGEEDAIADGMRTEYWIQFGAIDNSQSMIQRQPGDRRVAYSPRRLIPGRRHHFRIELEHDAIRGFVDGELWLENRDLFPVRSGHLQLYAYYPGKAFDDVRIWSKGQAELVPVLAIGDDRFLSGRHQEAAAAWSRVIEDHPGSELAADAALRLGMVEQLLGRPAAADRAWSALAGERAAFAAVMRLQRTWDEGELPRFTEEFTALWRRHPDQHGRMIALWATCRSSITRPHLQTPALRTLFEVLRRCFPDDPAGSRIDGWMFQLGWPAYCLQHYQDVPRVVAGAHLQLGLNRQILAQPDQEPYFRIAALTGLGRLDEALAVQGIQPDQVGFIHAKAGRPEAAQRMPNAAACVLAGQPQQALRFDTPYGAILDAARIQLGDLKTVMEATRTDLGWVAQMLLRRDGGPDDTLDMSVQRRRQLRWLQALEQGRRPDPASGRAIAADPVDHGEWSGWFIPWFALPFSEGRLAGAAGREEMERIAAAAAEVQSQRPRHLALLLAGRIDRDAFLAQPVRAEAQAWLLVGSGMRAELEGDRAGALRCYRAYLDLPLTARLLERYTVDPFVERFVNCRVQQLDPP